jgi:hypothetical protein
MNLSKRKPHIRISRIFKGMWACTNFQFDQCGYGSTPAAAYNDWIRRNT